MCYMAAGASVSVRELRQNLSRYLRRVEAGETLEVKSRGRRVALITPLSDEAGPWERMIAEGKVIPPTRDFADLGPPPKAKGRKSISDALDEVRQDRI